MKIVVKAFGITKDIIGASQLTMYCEGNTVDALRQQLSAQYPALAGLRSMMIAVNEAYAAEHEILNDNDTVALIPPVSGG